MTKVNHPISKSAAIDLLQGLVAIPSLSHDEATASAWLVAQMTALGYTRAYVDDAGNAVGEMGSADPAHTIVLLGHIDTVPGEIPVRIEATPAGDVLFGRGSVDAKGPLATFCAAGAKLGSAWAAEHGLRIVVVGAVEEEAATSKGARHIATRFDGVTAPKPDACVIGEPSGWSRLTLGYKGRLLIEFAASQPMAHTAGPETGVATLAVDFWNWLSAYAEAFNQGRERAFDQLSPSLRALYTHTDNAMHDHVQATVGIRLPLDFDVASFTHDLLAWAATHIEAESPPPDRQSLISSLQSSVSSHISLPGPRAALTFNFRGHETAWRSDRSNPLVRSFLSAIRSEAPDVRPGFVVKTGTSDMNVVGPLWNCPILAYGPGDSALDHTPNEHLSLDEYWRAVLILEGALRNLPAAVRQ